MKRKFFSLFQKELKNYFFSLPNYLYAVLFAGIAAYLYFQTFFVQNQADTNSWFQNLPFLLLFFIPALSMGSFSEEKKKGTWEILLTLPFNELQLVGGKFLAGLVFVIFLFLLNLGMVATLAFLGSPDWGVVFSSFLGAIFLASCYLATGIFISSLTTQQAVSFVLTFLFLFINDFFSQNFFLMRAPGGWKELFVTISLRSHYQNFIQGVISLSDSLFFLSWIFVFLLLTVISLKSRDF
ncbi:ABC transporter permease subunit [bacterium]|nr:ABC transporter permease subunit [bacterium]